MKCKKIISLIILTVIISKIVMSKTITTTVLESSENKMLSNENLNITYVESLDGVSIPIPLGYTKSEIQEETYVNTGFVIYEGEIDWLSLQNLEDGTSEKIKKLLEIQSEHNQYVWVPVNSDQVNTIYGVDNIGKLWGKLYSYTSSGRTARNWKEANGIISSTALNNYFEPGLGYGANANIASEKILRLKLNMSREELLRELEQYYYQTIKSIKKYGGFYIGRYETGIENNNAVVRKMNENLSNQSWSNMYLKTKNLKNENDIIITSMIWSSLMDYTIQWFIDSGVQTYNTVYNSSTWGNYKNSSFEYYADLDGNKETKPSGTANIKIIPSGSADSTKVNNIYDMAGNVNEMTLGSYGFYFCHMGGAYDASSSGKTSCASRGYQKIEAESVKTGSRAMLLIK